VGWAMKHCQWPRPPLVLGFILGKVIERYMFISIQRYGFAWTLRPVVLIMFALAVGVGKLTVGFGAARIAPENLSRLRSSASSP
jgi:TctA family transporter